jgi:hypothetical protein
MNEECHIRLIVKASKREVVTDMFYNFAQIILENGLHASAPSSDKLTH